MRGVDLADVDGAAGGVVGVPVGEAGGATGGDEHGGAAITRAGDDATGLRLRGAGNAGSAEEHGAGEHDARADLHCWSPPVWSCRPRDTAPIDLAESRRNLPEVWLRAAGVASAPWRLDS